MAACYLPLQQFQQALLHCHRAMKNSPKNVKTLYRQSQAHLGLGNLIDAASDLWECCTLEPSNHYFKAEFQKCVEQAKAQHKASS